MTVIGNINYLELRQWFRIELQQNVYLKLILLLKKRFIAYENCASKGFAIEFYFGIFGRDECLINKTFNYFLGENMN